MGETGQSLQSIMVQVAEINTIVAEIAASAKEQATGIEEISTAINQMDQMTQQNAAMVEERAAASHSLSAEASRLAALSGEFETGSVQNISPPRGQPQAPKKPVKSAPVRAEIPKTRKAAITSAPTVKTPLPARKTPLAAVANSTHAVNSAESWEEF